MKSTKHKTTHCATVAEFKKETNYLSSLGRINRLDTNPVFRRHRRGSCVPFFDFWPSMGHARTRLCLRYTRKLFVPAQKHSRPRSPSFLGHVNGTKATGTM